MSRTPPCTDSRAMRHMMRTLGTWVVVAMAGLAGCAGTGRPAAHFEDSAGGPIIATGFGRVQGTDGDVLAFKGMPYAKPPVGALRWTAPTDPLPEAAIRNA